MKVAKYILGILFIITGLGVITQKSIITGIAFLILGVVLLPTVSDKLKENVSFWQNKIVRYVSYIVLFIIQYSMKCSIRLYNPVWSDIQCYLNELFYVCYAFNSMFHFLDF